jgi:Uma2 family endonuclease
MLTTAVRFGPKSHGRPVTDEELQHAEYRPGYDYEVIFGRLYVSPAPNPEHDVVEKHIYNQIYLYSLDRPDVVGYLTDRARVFVASEEKTTAPEPDLAVYANSPDDDWREAEPFIVGEVLRGDSVDKDLFRNVSLYWQVTSIQEYWVIDIRQDSRRPTLSVYRRARGDWDVREYPPDAIYETPLLPGLKLRISPPARVLAKRSRKRKS